MRGSELPDIRLQAVPLGGKSGEHIQAPKSLLTLRVFGLDSSRSLVEGEEQK